MKQPTGTEVVLVSACLLGRHCRYDGDHRRDEALERELAAAGIEPVTFCPEEHGGLGTPRPAAWIAGSDAAAVADGTARVVDEEGRDVTEAFLHGARGALELCRHHGIVRAILKERSPSCGVHRTYVERLPVDGRGVTTELLERYGVRCEPGRATSST